MTFSIPHQTLYGHTGTVTGLFVYGHHILSCSTDRTIRVWAKVEGRQHLTYPWYEQQVRVWGDRGGGLQVWG